MHKDKLEAYQGKFQSMRRTFQGSVNVLLKECIKELPTPAYFSANISATFSAEFMDFFLGSVPGNSVWNAPVDASDCPRIRQGLAQGIYLKKLASLPAYFSASFPATFPANFKERPSEFLWNFK